MGTTFSLRNVAVHAKVPIGQSEGVREWSRRLPPNAFGIAFGLSGLAALWRAMDPLVGGVRPVVAVLTVLGSAVWIVLSILYVAKCTLPGQLQRDVDDPVQGPFVSLAFIAGMMLGMLWYWLGVDASRYVVLVCAVAALLFGGWITGHWIATPFSGDLLHPGFFLPTVAGGLVAATALQRVGYHDLAFMAFGVGMICWIVLGSVLLQRLFVGPPLPTPLVPLLAIEVAPPAVAGNAWVALYPQANPVQFALAAYTVFMVLVQIRLIPQYRQVPFGPTFWAFTFSYASAATYGMHWLSLDPFPGGVVVAWFLALGMTGFIGWVAVRSIAMMRAGRYFPSRQPELTF